MCATQLIHADLNRLIDCALRAPLEPRCGVSANTRPFWDSADDTKAAV